MQRQFATIGGARRMERPVRCIACLAFVGMMASAFWAGAVFIGEKLLTTMGGF